jgi:nitroreductase
MDLKKVFEERRSVNFFDKEKKISNELLKDIINLALTAPSAFNLQPWEIIAVKSEEGKEKLFSVAGQQSKIKEAPVTLILVGDLNGANGTNPTWSHFGKMLNDEKKLEGYKSHAKELYGSTHEKKLKFAESNVGLLAMSIMYAAKNYNVDSHPISGIDFEGIKKEFGLGNDKTVVMLISIGYFDESKELYPRWGRRFYDAIVKEF